MSCGKERKTSKRLSYVPQDMAVDIKLTGRENVLLFARLYGIANPKDTTDEVLAIMELSDRADHLIPECCGRDAARSGARTGARARTGDVLFLDEPTIGLDVTARKKIWEHIRQLRKNGMTIFVTTHYMDEADQSATGRDHQQGRDRGTRHTCRIEGTTGKGRLYGKGLRLPGPGEIGGVRCVGQMNGEITFTADNGREAMPLIARALETQGIMVTSLSMREPTLDDVFLHAVGTAEEPGHFDYQQFRTMLRRRK